MSKLALAPAKPKPVAPAAALETIPERLPQQFLATDLEIERHARAAGDEGGAEEEVITVTISTETPHKRRFGVEILEHSESAIDWSLAKQGLALLLEHGGEFDPYFGTAGRVLEGHHLGMVYNVRLDGKKLKGDLYFEEHEAAQRVKRGMLAKPPTRRYVSCGWAPILAKQTKVAKEPGEFNEYRWIRWKPVEVSPVSIPADPNAGLSARSGGGAEYPVTVEGATPAQEEKEPMKLNPKMDGEPAGGGTQARGGAPVADPPPASAAVEVDTRAFAKRAGEIMRACRASGAEQLAESMIERNLTIEQAKAELFDHRAKASGGDTLTAPPSPEEIVSRMNKKERKSYNYTRALAAAADLAQGIQARGFEVEIHQDMVKSGVQKNAGSFMVPLSLRTADDEPRAARTLGTGVAGGGAELVYPQVREMIDVLRENSILSNMGANVLEGLTQPVEWPRATADPTFQWKGESPATPTDPSQPAFDTVTMGGKGGSASVPIPKQLLRLSGSFSVDEYIKRRLGVAGGLFVDRGGFRGIGGQHQPLGVMVTPGIQTLDINAVPSWVNLKAAETKIAKQNAAFGVLGWVMSTDLAGVLMAKLKDSVAGSTYLWEGDWINGRVGPYRASSSPMVPGDLGDTGIIGGGTNQTAIFGKWDEVYIGLFGPMELMVDHTTLMDYQQIKVGAFLMADVAVSRIQAFCLLLRAKLT